MTPVTMPSDPQDPIISRVMSYPDTFFIVFPPKERMSPLGATALTPSSRSRTVP